jgi:hypothetical protein
VTLARPEAGCVLVPFRTAHPMDEASEVALEDYARVLARAQAAEAVPAEGAPGMVQGVHLCGAALPVAPATLADIEGFAESLLALRAGGLGWS